MGGVSKNESVSRQRSVCENCVNLLLTVLTQLGQDVRVCALFIQKYKSALFQEYL